jgi:hypothetical protein
MAGLLTATFWNNILSKPALARKLRMNSVSLVIGLIVRAEAAKNRTAARIAKVTFSDAKDEALTVVSNILRLKGRS